MLRSFIGIKRRRRSEVSPELRDAIKLYNSGDTFVEIMSRERFDELREEGISSGALYIALEPGMIRKTANFAKATVRDVRTGRGRVSEEVRTHRMRLCRGCELYNGKKGTCKHPACGCVMTRKTRWASTECPIGRWGASTK